MTSLHQLKLQILWELWKEGSALRPKEIAKRLDCKFPVVMMHLIGLKKMGYVFCPEKGCYQISNSGRQILGFPEVSKDVARSILSPVPIHKASYFCEDIDNYIGTYAISFEDFVEKLEKINVKSIKFHLMRGDFENWFNAIGDKEMATRISLLRKEQKDDAKLRSELVKIVKDRVQQLSLILTS